MTDQTALSTAIRQPALSACLAGSPRGWTPARKAQFLDHLAHDGAVRTACGRVGMSREAAYHLRRRDAAFARAWDAALVIARTVSAEVLECRAIHGVEEEVWYRGELVGTRRKYDSRLLLAHMARLDKLAEDSRARDDAARFDELLALVAGERADDGCECDDDGLVVERDDHMEIAAEDAEEAFAEAWLAEHPEADEDEGELSPTQAAARTDRLVAEDRAYAEGLAEARWRARLNAAAQWDQRRARSLAAVDSLLAEPLAPLAEAGTVSTVSGVSTSRAAPSEGAAIAEGYARVNPLNNTYARA
uniref:hypothetical protein n=1 Tax=Altererythrobacter segetis TaxID=1104773 RepID=UPI001407FC40|nr:hypothetical protein [Altererythrobacter segetis]